MVRALIAVALVLAPEWQVVKGKRFDVFALKKADASKLTPAAEETAKRFEELLGEFPGDRAAVLLRGEDDPEDPDWRRDGATWMLTHRLPRIVLVTPEFPDGLVVPHREAQDGTFRHDLAIRTLLEWSDRRAEDPPRGDGSGTRLPDWWEEAVAGWCDAQAVRDARRRTMADILSLRKELPLDKMLTLVRTQDPGSLSLPGGLPPGLPPEVVDALGKARPPVLPAQSLSFLEYLVENEGVAFVRHAADLQARGLGLLNALPWLKEHGSERAKPRTPVPESTRDLEKAWLAWARARRP